MKLKIKVTKEIIEKAIWCGTESEAGYHVSENCAVALAVRDIFPKACVCHSVFYPFEGAMFDAIIIPPKAQDFIKHFDRLADNPEARLYMDPIEFEVDIPDSVIEHIGIDEVKKIVEKSETLELV
jgi:hypothetical protein